ncbi:MAG: B12-binding domain-containing radical SAM protein [Myxococcota bacterium]
MSVTLINPPEQLRVWCGIPKAAAAGVYCFPPLGLMYLQASLEKRTAHRAEIFDPTVGNLDYPMVEQKLRGYDLDVVGISTYTHALPDVAMMIRLVKKYNPRAHVVLGGPHCSMFPDLAAEIEGVDSIIVGDGEETFIDIVENLNRGKSLEGVAGAWYWEGDTLVRNKERPTKRHLSEYPWPDRRRVDYKGYYVPGSRARYVTTAVTSRGCPHSCPFCLAEKGSYRMREIDDILDEVEHCLSLGIGEVHFVDDLFTPNSQWVLEFADAIERRKLKFLWGYKTTIAGTSRQQIKRSAETGCHKIHFGVETANNEGLDGYKKHCNTDDVKRVFEWCREFSVRSVAYLMIAGPHERTRADVLRNVDLAIDLDPDYAVIAVFSPYPGTPAFHEGVQKGLFEADCWDKMMREPLAGHKVPVAWEEHLSRDEILELLKVCHRKFYLRPKFIQRNLAPKTPWELKRLLGGALSLLKIEGLRPQVHGSVV